MGTSNTGSSVRIPLERGYFYHVYNRGNNRENLFRQDWNYWHFLRLYYRHIFPIAETFAFVLMPNHFHFLLRLKRSEEIEHGLASRHPSRSFANLFAAFTRVINDRYARTGSLFERPFRRKRIDSADYFLNLIHYIHLNPQQHAIAMDYRLWPYTSVRATLDPRRAKLATSEICRWFGESTAVIEQEFVGRWVVVLRADDFRKRPSAHRHR